MTSCLPCPYCTSTWGSIGAGHCDPCPGGTYSSGTFLGDLGSLNCYTCPQGTWSDSGAGSCTPCPSGYYNNNNRNGVSSCSIACFPPTPQTYTSCVNTSNGIFTMYQRESIVSLSGRYQLILQDDGNFVGYDLSTTTNPKGYFWNINHFDKANMCPISMQLQTDGNLMAWTAIPTPGPYWATNSPTSENSIFQLCMQNDRNIVIYDSNNVAIWNSQTQTS